jgi:hypothetical protein
MSKDTRDVVIGLAIISVAVIVPYEIAKRVVKRVARKSKFAQVIPFRRKEQEKAS